MYFDPMYFLFVGPAMLLAMFAQYKVKAAYATGKQIAASSGLTGAETAQKILDANSIRNVGIEVTPGALSDHYDPKAKMLRLSPDVYHGRSLASLGIAAHEVGHALQDAQKYTPLVLRNGIVPMASIGSRASFFLFFIGAMLNSFGMIAVGIGLFSIVVIFQLINLPVEFDASARARRILLETGMVSSSEDKAVGKVLNAAALTYVAATITAIATLIYYVVRSGVLNRR